MLKVRVPFRDFSVGVEPFLKPAALAPSRLAIRVANSKLQGNLQRSDPVARMARSAQGRVEATCQKHLNLWRPRLSSAAKDATMKFCERTLAIN